MILKVNDNSDYNLRLTLNIDYERKSLGLVVTVWDKKNHTTSAEYFTGDQFAEALDRFDKQEKILFG